MNMFEAMATEQALDALGVIIDVEAAKAKIIEIESRKIADWIDGEILKEVYRAAAEKK